MAVLISTLFGQRLEDGEALRSFFLLYEARDRETALLLTQLGLEQTCWHAEHLPALLLLEWCTWGSRSQGFWEAGI